ncbi:MAG: DUF1839 family protein [Acidimicrobiales bacterium]
MRADVLGLDPAWYVPHPLHAPERTWSETNCAADLWIEVVHALGHDPVDGLGFAFAGDVDGDQWRMFTYSAEDLWLLYGIEADELNVWRPLREHVAEQLALGTMVAVDVDAWWLPDTAGLTYRCAHQKTTILAQMVDIAGRRLGYFHNTGYHELEGEDFDALLPAAPASSALPPYALQVRLGRLRPPGETDGPLVRHLVRRHLARRPTDNPVARLGARVGEDLAWVAGAGMEIFHRWAFGTVRQCGANAGLAAELAGRLAPDGPAAARFDRVSTGMKAAELALARAVRGRAVDVAGLFQPLAEEWERAVEDVVVAASAAPAGAPPPRLATPA